ncbi:MAG: hypothetical protein ACW99F_04845, partial [Candidatus Hodarchaeales archaeon]
MCEQNKLYSFSDLFGSNNSVFQEEDENQGEKIFTSSFTPKNIWHREEEMRMLVSYFKSIITSPTASSRKVV